MLEQSLVSPRSERRSFYILPLSAALHVVIIAVAVAAAVWTVELPTKVPDQVGIYRIGEVPVIPGPPPARRGSDEGGTPPKRSETPAVTSQTPAVIPEDIPDLAQPGTEPAEGDAPGEGPGGDPDGSPDGVPGGFGPGGGTGVVDGGGAGEILRPGGNVTVPVIVSRVDPEYPELARKIGLEGIVILECIIGRDGSVRDPRVVRSPHALLERAAIDAVTRWRYRPATLNGQPVDVYFHLTVRFTMNR